MKDIIKKADISSCGKYRYSLERDWSGKDNAPYMLFVCINPSTADAVTDDATVRKCKGFAKTAGYERIFITNLYSYRTKDWNLLLSFSQPERLGPNTDNKLFELVRNAGLTVAAWGNLHDNLCKERADHVITEIRKICPLYVLGLTGQGCPVHPLRFRYGMPVLWQNKI
jgi:hypothetical protein